MDTDWILQLLSTLGDWGYIGVAGALMVEVIPSELVLGYAGYLVHEGKISLVGAMLSGMIGGTLAQVFLYWLGRYGGRPFFDRYGKFLLMPPRHIAAAEKWFEKHGTFVVFTARFIPVVRHAISIPAGMSRMPLSSFCLYTFAAMFPWTLLFLLVGMQLGTHWQHIEVIGVRYIKPLAAIAIGGIALYVLFTFLRSRKRR
ncbi:DedA family protein [Rossellomorea marisflavi]|uniref:DedA family protein n=1 Tax=Rossellomorea marisflavi TaxID=189381 RepID=UPI0034580018